MSSIGDLSDTASAIGCASQLDDSNRNVTPLSLTPSSSSASSISRQKSSPIWQYCRIEDGQSNLAAWVNSDGRKWWHCQPCFGKKKEKKYNYSGGSSTIIEPVMMISDSLKWWLELAQRRRFPNLSLMAIDILSIAPMSAETERLFSKAKLTVTNQRGSMNCETLNLLECLRSWDSSALIVPSACRYVDPAVGSALSDA